MAASQQHIFLYKHILFKDYIQPITPQDALLYKVDNQPSATLRISRLVIVTLPFRENPV